MANQITHVVLLEKVFDTFFAHHDKGEVLTGTLFPDIRYLGGISREKTHVIAPTLIAVKNASSGFESGRIFHCLVDEVRERFMRQHDVYSFCPESKYITQALKCFEDERYYHHVGDWSQIIRLYAAINPAEYVQSLPSDHPRRWHDMLCRYMSQEPSDDTRSILIKETGFNEDFAKEINRVVGALRSKKEIVDIVDAFLVQFLEVLEGGS